MKACVIRGARQLSVDTFPDPSPGPAEAVVAFGAGGICGARFPYVSGVFGEFIVATEAQCVPFGPSMSFRTAARREPLAVASYAVGQAGRSLVGTQVLICGAGPIGLRVALVARFSGSMEIVSADLALQPLDAAHAPFNVDPVLTVSTPLSAAVDAFELALDRGRSLKVNLLPD